MFFLWKNWPRFQALTLTPELAVNIAAYTGYQNWEMFGLWNVLWPMTVNIPYMDLMGGNVCDIHSVPLMRTETLVVCFRCPVHNLCSCSPLQIGI